MSGSALSEQKNERARAFVRRVVDEDFRSNITAAARSWAVSPTLLSEFLHGKRGTGIKLLDAVAQHAQVTIEAIISGTADAPQRAPTEDPHPSFGRMTGWPTAEERARSEAPYVPEWAFLAARQFRGLKPARVSPELVLAAALLALRFGGTRTERAVGL